MFCGAGEVTALVHSCNGFGVHVCCQCERTLCTIGESFTQVVLRPISIVPALHSACRYHQPLHESGSFLGNFRRVRTKEESLLRHKNAQWIDLPVPNPPVSRILLTIKSPLRMLWGTNTNRRMKKAQSMQPSITATDGSSVTYYTAFSGR